MIVRIQRAEIKNFRNVLHGEIRFPCNLEPDIFTPSADVLGIYGQNGSGKTTFLHALEILRMLLSGHPLPESLEDCISAGKETAELIFEFSMLSKNGGKYKSTYSAILSQTNISETLKVSCWSESDKWSRSNLVLSCDLSDYDTLFLPATKRKELFGNNQKIHDELRVTKLLCAKERRSFIFSKEFLDLLSGTGIKNSDTLSIFALRSFAKRDFYVILNRYTGLISLDAALPFNFRTESAHGQFLLPIDKSTVVPEKLFPVIEQVINTINIVLKEIIPNMVLSLFPLGAELLKDGMPGTRVQIVQEHWSEDIQNAVRLPLRYESEGIKKIVSILHLLIAAFNNPSITLAIDELDSGIYEYLLGELLDIMQNSGQGQLIFTSHNLCPLETLKRSSIVFTTTNPNDRYTRFPNIKATNNLRLKYLREVSLGGGGKNSLYAETNSLEIAHAMRVAGQITSSLGNDSMEEDA